MITQMKVNKNGSIGEIKLVVPAEYIDKIQWAISGFLNLSGHEVVVAKLTHSHDKVDKLFPHFHPGMHLRGLRVRDSISHQEMADKLGLKVEQVSDIEKGHMPISPELAILIGRIFKISHRVFDEK